MDLVTAARQVVVHMGHQRTIVVCMSLATAAPHAVVVHTTPATVDPAHTHQVTARRAKTEIIREVTALLAERSTEPKALMGNQSQQKFQVSTTHCLPRMHCAYWSVPVLSSSDWGTGVFRTISLKVTNRWLDEAWRNSSGSSRFRAQAAKYGGIGMFKRREEVSRENRWRAPIFRPSCALTAWDQTLVGSFHRRGPTWQNVQLRLVWQRNITCSKAQVEKSLLAKTGSCSAAQLRMRSDNPAAGSSGSSSTERPVLKTR